MESILDSSIASAGSFVVTPTALSRQPPLTKEIGMVIGLMEVERYRICQSIQPVYD